MRAHVWVGRRSVRGVQYYANILFFEFSFCIHCADLLKLGVLTLVGKIPRYRNDLYYCDDYYCYY